MQAAKLRQRRGDPDFANSAAEAIAKLLVSGELRGLLDLRGMAIETDKPIAGLPVFNLFRTHVSKVDLSCSQIEGSMSEAVFDQVHFDRSKLSHVRAAKTVFRSCTFDGATLRLNVDDARFESCSFRDASFIATAFSQGVGRAPRFLHPVRLLGRPLSAAGVPCQHFRELHFRWLCL